MLTHYLDYLSITPLGGDQKQPGMADVWTFVSSEKEITIESVCIVSIQSFTVPLINRVNFLYTDEKVFSRNVAIPPHR